MKILSAEQIRQADKYTIENESISSIDLMERASRAFTAWFTSIYDVDQKVLIFAGPGNNGGDGLAIARMLYEAEYSVEVCLVEFGKGASKDYEINLNRLRERTNVKLTKVSDTTDLPVIETDVLAIDAILGNGLSRPPEGFVERIIRHINEKAETIVSVDIPSGLFADQQTTETSIIADRTCSFELPKLAFMLPENFYRVGEWTTVPIGLSRNFIAKQSTPYCYVDLDKIRSIYRPRKKGGHKGTFGHSLLICGSKGKMGAAVLAAKAALHSGTGLITSHVPGAGVDILQITVPDAMVSIDPSKHCFSKVPSVNKYNSVGVGCGLGNAKKTIIAMGKLLTKMNEPFVLDADALNIIAANPGYMERIPDESILTPHPKEFERLFGTTQNHFERLELLRRSAQEQQVYIILKGAHTAIATPDGNVYFNSTGNPGMATAGSGDVLTGVLTSILAQRYTPFQTAILGTWLHGRSGDVVAHYFGYEASAAYSIASYMGEAFKSIVNS